MISRHGYLMGASPQRPIEPVRSLMEEYVRNGTLEVVGDIIVEPEAPVITCPCGTVHDGSHGLGKRKGNVKLCVACYRERRLAGLKKAMAERQAIIARAKEPRIVQVDFRSYPEIYDLLLTESRMDVRTLEQQIIYCLKSYMED